jgi:hypothetical protein
MPLSKYTLDDMARLSKDTLRAEIKARGITGFSSLSQQKLAELLFFKLRTLKELSSTLADIDHAEARGELDEVTADVARQQAHEVADDDDADTADTDIVADGGGAAIEGAVADGGGAAVQGKSATDQDGTDHDEVSSTNAMEIKYKNQQITELMTLQAVISAAERRLRSVVELLRDCAAAGYHVDPAAMEEPIDSGADGADSMEIDEPSDEDVAKCVAQRAVGRAIALTGGTLKPGSNELLRLATQARLQISELFEGRRVAADKLFAFMLGDLEHRGAYCPARFATHATMNSQKTDKLVDYVALAVYERSKGQIDVIFEKCDGAKTMLVREDATTVRSSARTDLPAIDAHKRLPRSLRECSLETNHAVEEWQHKMEVTLHERFEAMGNPQHVKSGEHEGTRSNLGAVFKKAMKDEIFKLWCLIVLATPPPRWPDLHGWIHQAKRGPAFSRIGIKLQGGGGSEGDKWEGGKRIHGGAKWQHTIFDASGIPSACIQWQEPAGSAAPAAAAATATVARPAEGARAANAASASTTATTAAAATTNTPTATTDSPTVSDPTANEAKAYASMRSAREFVDRVLAFERASDPDPISNALRGAGFSIDSITDPGFRDLISRMMELRPPTIVRPLIEKMRALACEAEVVDDQSADADANTTEVPVPADQNADAAAAAVADEPSADADADQQYPRVRLVMSRGGAPSHAVELGVHPDNLEAHSNRGGGARGGGGQGGAGRGRGRGRSARGGGGREGDGWNSGSRVSVRSELPSFLPMPAAATTLLDDPSSTLAEAILAAAAGDGSDSGCARTRGNADWKSTQSQKRGRLKEEPTWLRGFSSSGVTAAQLSLMRQMKDAVDEKTVRQTWT